MACLPPLSLSSCWGSLRQSCIDYLLLSEIPKFCVGLGFVLIDRGCGQALGAKLPFFHCRGSSRTKKNLEPRVESLVPTNETTKNRSSVPGPHKGQTSGSLFAGDPLKTKEDVRKAWADDYHEGAAWVSGFRSPVTWPCHGENCRSASFFFLGPSPSVQ